MKHPEHLTEKEKEEIRQLDLKIAAAQLKRASYLRDVFRSRGLIAPTLEELKSDSGEPFIREERIRDVWGYDYEKASAIKKTRVGLLVKERAYLCREMFDEKDGDPNGCGWVKGEPSPVLYNNISLLSGSAGTEYYCQLCGKKIGEHQSVIS